MDKNSSMEDIRKAVLKNRGGLSEATNGQIMIIWKSLDTPTQEKYLATIKKSEAGAKKAERKDANAVSDTSRSTV